ncbi:MAG: hypothetical protein M1438_16765 [Deltaproteobacteria bacterium]|nr:hypothetical protein [Deltaproteobacteria bacterium]
MAADFGGFEIHRTAKFHLIKKYGLPSNKMIEVGSMILAEKFRPNCRQLSGNAGAAKICHTEKYCFHTKKIDRRFYPVKIRPLQEMRADEG